MKNKDINDIGMITLFICFWSIFSTVAIIALVIPFGMIANSYLKTVERDDDDISEDN